MKRFYLFAMALLAVAFVGCKEDSPEVVTPSPTVELTAGAVTTESITFDVTSTAAEACAYMLYDQTVPTAEEVIANGKAVETNKTVTVTVDKLTEETTYNVAAAVKSGELTAIKTISMTTTALEAPTIEVVAVEATKTTITFTVTSTNAEKVTYYVTDGEMIETDMILVNGEDIEVNTSVPVTIKNLIPGTTYKVAAAARTGVVRVGSDVVEIATEAVVYPEAPAETNCILKGKAASGSFEIRIQDMDKTVVTKIDAGAKGSILDIMPEGEYVFDPNGNSSEGSQLSDYWFKSDDMLSGRMIVKHLAEGYEVLIQGILRGEIEMNYFYSGIIEPNGGNFGNPPIPYNDVTYTTAVSTVSGSHYRPGGWFNIEAQMDNGYMLSFALSVDYTVVDGIIPEGTYTVGGQMSLSSSSTMTFLLDPNDPESEVTLPFTENSVVEVEHLDKGYHLTFNVENGLKTKIAAEYQGLIETNPNQPYDFVNPGDVVEADYELEFTTVQRSADTDRSGHGIIYVLTNDKGDSADVCFLDSKVAADGPVAGLYAITQSFDYQDGWGFDYEARKDEFFVSGNDSPINFRVLNTEDEQIRGWYYPNTGTVLVSDGDNGTKTVVFEATFYNPYAAEGERYQIVRWTYNGTF